MTPRDGIAIAVLGFMLGLGLIWLCLFASEWRWFRRWRGGIWYNVTPYGDWSIQVWVRRTLSSERVNSTEDWS